MRGPGPAGALALLFGLGFGAGSHAVVSALGGLELGYRSWPLQAAAGLAAAVVAHTVFGRVREARAAGGPRDDRARRAVQRLAYRRGPTLSVALVARETLLDDDAAGAVVHAMREDGLVDGPDEAFRLR